MYWRASATLELIFAADPAALSDNRTAQQGLGEQQIESGGKQETVADQAVRRIKSCIVQHFEIAGAMHSSGCMIELLVQSEIDPAHTGVQYRQP